jgi:hypothetical protein
VLILAGMVRTLTLCGKVQRCQYEGAVTFPACSHVFTIVDKTQAIYYCVLVTAFTVLRAENAFIAGGRHVSGRVLS